jgi:hypothetical protein
MTRRDALKTMFAASLVPSWLSLTKTPKIDLALFCNHDKWLYKYDMSAPFIQSDVAFHKYATDARICVRVDAKPHERQLDSERKLPPAYDLAWNHDELRGWKPWPAMDHLLVSDECCPKCGGEGFVCEKGFAVECTACKGNGVGNFPGIQRIGPLFIAGRYDKKVRTLGNVEYSLSPDRAGQLADLFTPCIRFRSNGVDGLLMTLEEKSTKGRLV